MSTTRTFQFLVAMALFAAPTPAQPIEPTTPSAKHDVQVALPAARRLLDAIGYHTMISQMTNGMSAQFGPQMKQAIEEKTGEPANPEMIRRLAEAQGRFLRKFVEGPQLRQAIELLYAKHFSAVELDRMTVLMRDPVMQKWNARVPAVMTDMMPLIVKQIDMSSDELKAEIVSIISDYTSGPAAAATTN